MAREARIIWLMVPAGEIVDTVLQALRAYLKKDDIVIDGGNSKFTDSIRRAQELEKQGIFFLDCGTSGGLQGKSLVFHSWLAAMKQAIQKYILYFLQLLRREH